MAAGDNRDELEIQKHELNLQHQQAISLRNSGISEKILQARQRHKDTRDKGIIERHLSAAQRASDQEKETLHLQQAFERYDATRGRG